MNPVAQVRAQGTFQNLDFEWANVPDLPSGQGSLEPIAFALPYWAGYIESNLQSQVSHNNYSLGLPNLGLLGPVWIYGPAVIEGNYSAVIQAGYDLISQKSASLSQTALIPSSANSIQMKVQSPSYTLLGGDVTKFSGLTRELRITAIPALTDPYSSFVVDSIVFSNIPEPSALGLLGLGASLLGWGFGRGRAAPPTSPRATNATLTLNHLQTTDAGSDQVIFSTGPNRAPGGSAKAGTSCAPT